MSNIYVTPKTRGLDFERKKMYYCLIFFQNFNFPNFNFYYLCSTNKFYLVGVYFSVEIMLQKVMPLQMAFECTMIESNSVALRLCLSGKKYC